jgi:hypothetical protein
VPTDVFLSYSHADRQYVDALVPRFAPAGLSVWYDERIEAGRLFIPELEKNLEEAAAVVLLVSDAAKGSDWVQNEIAYAQARRKPIVPLQLQGEAWLAVAATEYADVTDGSLPDARFFDSVAQAVRNARRAGTARPVGRGVEPGLAGLVVETAPVDADAADWLGVRIAEEAEGSQVELPQLRMADRLIRAEVGGGSPPPTLAATLYQLLIPEHARGTVELAANLLLELDDATARYPWELLAAGPALAAEPLVVSRGMIRKPTASPERGSGSPTAVDGALVIGDPPPRPDRRHLDGARAEAETVRRQLEHGGIDVTASIGGDSDAQVLDDLFARPYAVLHVAASSFYRSDDPELSGMCLGRDTVITPLLIGRLAAIPQLVFFSCGHAGAAEAVGHGHRSRSSDVELNEFAAVVGKNLLFEGVQAVVIAGWTVDDAASAAFVGELYRQMTAGECFGDAVRSARRHVFSNSEFAHVNTWGAYQCYGDPGFRLAHAAEPRTSPDSV